MLKSDYLNGTWELSARKEIIDLAIQYYEQCEAFDRLHCSGVSPRTGNAMPVDSWELGIINRYALALRRELTEAAITRGASEEEWKAALRLASSLDRRSPC